jgi:methyl-accepting chemotaxis protein
MESLHTTVVRVIGAATLAAIVVLLASAYIVSRSIITALSGAQGMAKTMATGNFLGFENCRNDCSYGKAVNCRREQCEVGQLNISLETMRSSLSTAIGSVQKKAGEAADLAGVLASGTQQAAAATEHQAEQIQQVSAAIEQLNVSISQIASAGREVQDNSSESTRRAEAGVQATTDMCSNMGDIVAKAKETATAVSSLRASAKGIEQFTQTIKEIADQTNLLALNAAIEAARAGEQGRGFAVVADEVRKLAERTGTTTQSIDQLARQISHDISGTVTSIEAIERTAVHGMGVAESSAETLKHIMDATAQVQQMITEITSASSEQKSAADLSAQSMERIAAAAEENSAVIENVKSSAAEINAIADHLNDLSGRFKVATA